MNTRIEFISEDDASELDFEWELFHENINSISYVKERHFIGAYIDDVLIGRLLFEILSGRAHVKDLIVKKEYRGKGIGIELLRKFEDYCKEKGCHKLTTRTTKQHNAIDLFKKFGYAEEFVQKNDAFGWDWIWFYKYI